MKTALGVLAIATFLGAPWINSRMKPHWWVISRWKRFRSTTRPGYTARRGAGLRWQPVSHGSRGWSGWLRTSREVAAIGAHEPL
jgi:hypothetical protein